jgi:FAD-linked sulfhydryl oxidase
MTFDANVWGPHYWFFLHTIAMNYPIRPNTITKKKYYDFIQNIPMFIPIEQMATNFSKLLDEYPVTPYLDSRDAFVRWMHFIHNKVNEHLEVPKISLSQFYKDYYEAYKPKDIRMREYYKRRGQVIYVVVLLCILGLIYYLLRE